MTSQEIEVAESVMKDARVCAERSRVTRREGLEICLSLRAEVEISRLLRGRMRHSDIEMPAIGIDDLGIQLPAGPKF